MQQQQEKSRKYRERCVCKSRRTLPKATRTTLPQLMWNFGDRLRTATCEYTLILIFLGSLNCCSVVSRDQSPALVFGFELLSLILEVFPVWLLTVDHFLNHVPLFPFLISLEACLLIYFHHPGSNGAWSYFVQVAWHEAKPHLLITLQLFHTSLHSPQTTNGQN